MTTSAKRLRADLSRLQGLLRNESLLTFSDEERARFLQRSNDLKERLDAVEDEFLTIGLLGGTGVGKSSLMNALAGAPVSSTSHRRPHTDHVIVYRHEEAPPVPDPPPETIPWQEISHRADAIRHVLLCDLPDFDSLLAAHREGVMAFLGNLDLLVWVTSPEKYADRRLYEFLALVPKAQDNFIFVLNKMDLLFDEDGDGSGFPRLAAASTRFSEHLRDAGINAPVLFCVSAREALQTDVPSPWNQFPLLRQQVFQLRNAKQVRAIKSGNLDVEATRLFSGLSREIQGLGRMAAMLEEGLRQLKEDRPAWKRLGMESLRPWLESKAVREAFRPARDDLPLCGPGLALALLFLRPGKGTASESEANGWWQRLSPPAPVVASLQKRLAWLEDRLIRRMLQENLPTAMQERVKSALRQDARFEEMGERLFHIASAHTSRPIHSRLMGFRALQAFTYGLLLALLVFALGGPPAWQEIIKTPGLHTGIGLASSFIRNLFSAEGLAALGSFALLNLFFGVRFLLGYRRRLDRATDRAVEALTGDMVQVWTDQHDAILEDLAALEKDVRVQMDALGTFSGETD